MLSSHDDDDDASNERKEAEEPFLGSLHKTHHLNFVKNKRFLCLSLTILALSIVAHVAIFILWASFGKVNCRETNVSRLYSPFESVLSTNIEEKLETLWDNSVFVGPPSQKLDDAWQNLQEVIGISLRPDEASMIDLRGGIKTESGDSLVEVSYVHNLHCLRYLYQILHGDYYKEQLKALHGDPESIGLEHAYHCIEALRDSNVCRPDLNLYGIKWSDSHKSNLALETRVHRECVNYNSIFEIVRSRKVTPGMLADANDSFLGPALIKEITRKH